jgi:hypothetical protein
MLFAALLCRYLAQPLRSLWVGALLGMIWYYVSFRFFWASFNPFLVAQQSFPGMFFAHVVFGLCMGTYSRSVRSLPSLESQDD